MKRHPFARCVIYPTVVLVLAPGCQFLHQFRPMPVLVRDIETKKPVPGAEVRLSYALTQSSFTPPNSCATTGDDGIAQVQATPFGDPGIMIDVNAKGYLSEHTEAPVETVQNIKPPPLLGKDGTRPVTLVVEMYAEPYPFIELVLPDGYHGLVKVEVRARDDVPCPPGQRGFRYTVPSSGVLQVTGPALLGRVYSSDFRALYAAGTLLSPNGADADIGFRCLDSDANHFTFVAGTKWEFDDYRRSLSREDTGESQPHDGGSRRGRGRRNYGDNAISP